MKTFKNLLLLLVGLLVSLSCNGNQRRQAQPSQQKKTMKTTANKPEGKVLIVFFSHAGENYAVGNVKVGNTKLVADEIQQATGGTEFEVVAEKNYDMPYNQLIKIARSETENGEKPAFRGEVDNIADYDTIFIGGPIWWGTYPQVMFTFFDRYDLNGKTIIPFSTHEGSGLGSIVSDLRRLYPQATISHAKAFTGHKVRQSMADVDRWLKDMGY
ncbi:MAG: NAD(P)H-dependent oxidoreductase [Prevotella sp.]|nr:NAD(P)H-dependent oxidoreductase [Prevotella sp.]